MNRPLYQILASTLVAIENCRESNNAEWLDKHTDRLNKLVADYMPSGSGIDCGTKLDDSSTPDKLVFNTSFHHMDEGGGYDGWTEHTVIVKPSLAFDIDIKITGRDRNDIKEYLHDCYHTALTQELDNTAGYEAAVLVA